MCINEKTFYKSFFESLNAFLAVSAAAAAAAAADGFGAPAATSGLGPIPKVGWPAPFAPPTFLGFGIAPPAAIAIKIKFDVKRKK